MQLPENIGRTEILIAAGVVVALIVVAIPLYAFVSSKGSNTEAAEIVEAIRAAEIARFEAFPADGYVATDWTPRAATALTAEAVPWATNDGFTKLGWSAARALGYANVRGTYRVKRTKDGFTVVGRIDADGDGEPTVWEATAETPAAIVAVTGD